MNSRFVGILLLIIVVACFVTGVIVYPALPANIISHWNAAGHANGSMGKFWGTFFLPILMLVFVGLWALLPQIDPLAPGFKAFRRVYDFVWFMVIAFLAYIYALVLGANLGWPVHMIVAIMPVLGLFIFMLGVLFPHIKRNWFVGIRTPWTIASDTVWRRTHHLASILFKAAGLVIFASALTEPQLALWLVFVPIIVAALVPAIYSYFLYRSEAVH